MYDINKDYICVMKNSCVFESKDGKLKNEDINIGCIIVFIDNDFRFKKKNGNRIYKAKEFEEFFTISNFGINLFFIPFENLKYKGNTSSVLGLETNKFYVYGGFGKDGVRIFKNKPFDSKFLDFTDFEFNLYFKETVNVTAEEFERSLNFINYQINELTTIFDSSSLDSGNFTSIRISELIKCYVERKQLLLNFKDNLIFN